MTATDDGIPMEEVASIADSFGALQKAFFPYAGCLKRISQHPDLCMQVFLFIWNYLKESGYIFHMSRENGSYHGNEAGAADYLASFADDGERTTSGKIKTMIRNFD